MHNSGNNEWYTPPEFIESAKAVMGGIDTDPASNDIAQGWIGATNYFTVETNGLDKDWLGRVWMNPPYSSNLINQFIEKLGIETLLGNTSEFVVLCNNATETKWFKSIAAFSSAICFIGKRIRFVSPDGTLGKTPLQGQCALYGGSNVDKFIREFSKHGFVLVTPSDNSSSLDS